MADGPRCKRRKQANPKRTSVTEFNNGLEASSDSDDEDKLHIVEDESLQDAVVADADGTTLQESQDAATTVLPLNGSLNGVKEEYVSEEEEVVKEILQQGDTAIIYPEAPDDEHSPAETGGADENGTPDSFSQLHICPYCARGYKRNASLKEHIKYRHETSDDNYSCSHCSYTFTYRSQLERHMNHHRPNREQRHSSQPPGGTPGTRKFKCTECGKAFKYKHHLKEHLRIHSGEKPYECLNCKKRFSHSGSYSSHISSKKCAAPLNGVPRTTIKPPTASNPAAPVIIAPARVVLKEKTDSKPLQEQLPVTQIKSEPVEYACKPVMATQATSAGTNGVVNGGTTQPAVVSPATLPQGVAMVVPTVGLMSPISINLNDLQSVLKVAMDGNVLRQVLGTANGVVTQGKQGIVVQQPQQQIISLPAFVDHDGTTKIIINYSINPAAATTATTQPSPLLAKTNPTLPLPTVTTAAAPTPSKTDNSPPTEVADLSIVKSEPESVPITDKEAGTQTEKKTVTTSVTQTAHMPKVNSSSTCLLCDDCPDHLEALHLLQHRKAANGEAVDSAALDPSFAALLSEAGVTLEEPPVDDLLSLLKNYFASNANPSEEELIKISESVSIPVDVIRKWFAKMNSGKKHSNMVSKKTKRTYANSEKVLNRSGEAEKTSSRASPISGNSSPNSSPLCLENGDLVIVKQEPEDPETQSSQAEPLDLSLPKHLAAALGTTPPPSKQQDRPLNLTCLRKEQFEGRTIYVTTPQAGPVNIVSAGQLPTLVAIAGQSSVGCLSSVNTSNKRTILIPQLSYSYATAAGNATEAKTVVLNGHRQEKQQDTSPDSLQQADEELDSDSAAKRPRLGVYPCDLCCKVFQKGSSLLRHKYEHTGKRPHECPVCKKAFKHKHHLIEHSRLHSGEKPYQCDKCGKRFSHSGSYSQHMNHRYSYCKKDGPKIDTGFPLHRPGMPSSPPSLLNSDEEEEEDEEAMCMDDIRVVQVDDGECEIYEGNFDDDDDYEDEEEVERQADMELVCDVVEVELGDEHMEHETMEKTSGEMEKAPSAVMEKATDCEGTTEKSARDESESAEPMEEETTQSIKPTEEVMDNATEPTEQVMTDSVKPTEEETTDSAEPTEKVMSNNVESQEEEATDVIKLTVEEKQDYVEPTENEATEADESTENETTEADESTGKKTDVADESAEGETAEGVRPTVEETSDNIESAKEEATETIKPAEEETLDNAESAVEMAEGVESTEDVDTDGVKPADENVTNANK